jgi:hypothetical protein
LSSQIVSSFQPRPISLGTLQSTKYNLTIFALGYESRAIELLRLGSLNSNNVLAIGFNYGKTLSFAENRKAFLAVGAQVEDDIQDENFEKVALDHIDRSISNVSDELPIRLLIDISCFNRFRLAVLIDLIRRRATQRNFIVDFFYSLAKYVEPSSSYTPNEFVRPVHPAFSGWSTTPADPTAAIVGLGYEQDQALGIVEYLQANPVWLFSPSSAERRYLPAVKLANQLLLEELDESYVVQYSVEQPIDIFQQLDGMIRGLQHDHNVVVVPFGPKIFVLCSLLAAWRHPTAAVWRVSPGLRISPQDRRASRYHCLLRVETSSGREL